MKLDNKDLALFTLLIIPGFGFGYTLRFGEFSEEWWARYDTRVSMMFICVAIASVSFGVLISRISRKKK